MDAAGTLRRHPTASNPTMNAVPGTPRADALAAEPTREVQQAIVDHLDEAGFLPPKQDPRDRMNRRVTIRDFQTAPDMGALPDRRQAFLQHMYGDLADFNHKNASIVEPESELAGEDREII